jgi:hypothetical protein
MRLFHEESRKKKLVADMKRNHPDRKRNKTKR